MSDPRKGIYMDNIICAIYEAQLLRIVQTLVNEINALKSELVDIRAEVAIKEKKCKDAETTLKLLREQLSDVGEAAGGSMEADEKDVP